MIRKNYYLYVMSSFLMLGTLLLSCEQEEGTALALESGSESTQVDGIDVLALPAANDNRVAYYAFDATPVNQGKLRLTNFTDNANIIVAFEGTLWELADSVHYGGSDAYILNINGGPYSYYSQILDDIQILRQRGVKVLMNLDDRASWSTSTPFTTWDGTSYNYQQFASFVYNCVLAAGFDGISLDVEHGATGNTNYRNLIVELGKYFGPLSSNSGTLIYTGAFYSGGAPGPIFREPVLSQYLNFVMDMAYFQNNDSRFSYWANSLGNSKVMVGMSHQYNSLSSAVAHAEWHPSPDKAGIMVFAGNVNKEYTDAIFAALNGDCSPTTLTPYVNVNNGGWEQTSNASLNVGGTVALGPGPNTGTWSWTGPNNYTASVREVTISNITTSQAGGYIATNTNSCGEQSRVTFVINVSGSCIPTSLTPYVNVNGGGWHQTNAASLNAGGTVVLGPGPNTGTWSWTGPNNYMASVREITIGNITTSQAGTYTATNVNDCGAQSSVSFSITVNRAR